MMEEDTLVRSNKLPIYTIHIKSLMAHTQSISVVQRYSRL